MIVTAIIAEYNPFHLGHKYHIEQARKLTNADIVLVIMSGNFVQRGEPAILDKHLRSKVALSNGADIVIELPFPYACSSAEYFAQSAVTILNKLGCVDYLCFGSECDNIDYLYDIAKILTNEPEQYKRTLKDNLKEGITFPKARHNALISILKEDYYNEILSMPNNILGIEYIKSLLKLNSDIKPCTIKRIISDYHHSELNNPYYSASSIRNDFSNGTLNMNDLIKISDLYMSNELCPIELSDFNTYLAGKLAENRYKLNEFFDISSDLADRISNNIDKFKDFSEFIELIKSKNNNYSSISRALCNIMLGITKNEIYTYKSNGYADYVRVLGFNDTSLPIFKLIETHDKIKLITKMSKAEEILSSLPNYNKKVFDKNMFVDDLYRLTVQSKYKINLPNEYMHKIR